MKMRPNQSLYPCLRRASAGGGHKLIPIGIISGHAAKAWARKKHRGCEKRD